MAETSPSGDVPGSASETQPIQTSTPKQPKDSRHLTSKQVWWILGGCIAFVIAVVGIALAVSQGPTTTPIISVIKTPRPSPSQAPAPSLLDGVVVSYELATRHPLAVMVENIPTIRPQTGLGDASIVYEAITEGGITRFMAVYGHKLPEKVGPVRSARTVFLDFAEEFTPGSAYFVHAGGSPEALGKINGDRVNDLNHDGSGAFQRFPKAGLASEHTLYAFPSKLFDLAKSKGYETRSDFLPWKFKDDEAIANRPKSQKITVPFSGGPYDVTYNYDQTTNTYKRSMTGVEHKDATTGAVLAPKNVVVEYVSYASADAKGRQNVKVIGEGKAKILLDGTVIEAKWLKSSSPARTVYTDVATGQAVTFNRGQIWVEVVKLNANVAVTQPSAPPAP